MKRNKLKTGRSLIFLSLIIITSYIIFYNRFTIYDNWVLANYHPSQNIQTLTNDDTFTSYSKTIFYINKPKLLDKSQFQKICPNINPKIEIVLGCYYPNENGIYILSVSDPALNGIEQVTAAHEMLHGIYSRLSSSQKNNLDNLLEYFYQNVLTDNRVKNEISIYRQTEPNSVFDEMNSTFATEITVLTPALESFYDQFFTNRLRIVKYEQGYQNVFIAKNQLISSEDTQLSELNTLINNLENQASSLNNKLKNDLNIIKSNQNSTNYSQLIDNYNLEINQYNNLVNQITSSINQYNQIVDTRNQNAISLNNLVNLISPKTK